MEKTKEKGFSGLWSVDHILPAKEYVRHKGSGKPYEGSLIRLLNYKKDVEAKIGHRYLLVDAEHASLFKHGFTYFLPKSSVETTEVTFNSYIYPIRTLVKPVETDEEINESLRTSIGTHLSEARETDDFRVSRPRVQPLPKLPKEKEQPWARVHIQHVGQGDTIVLELPNDQLWMIDARFWTNKRRDIFDKWWNKTFKTRRLNRLIISHLHYDHIHSAPYIINRYRPEEVLITNTLNHRTASVLKLLHASGNRLRVLKKPESISLGALDIHLDHTANLYNVNGSDDPNDHEILVSLKADKNFVFLAGDAPGFICHNYLEQHKIDASKTFNYYKVSHHGSRTGYDKQYFKLLKPNRSVISCGQNNRFNHPHGDVLRQLYRPTITWQMSDYVTTWGII